MKKEVDNNMLSKYDFSNLKKVELKDKIENILDRTLEENGEKATEQNAEYIAMLDKSMAEAEAGKFITKTIDELETYEKCIGNV